MCQVVFRCGPLLSAGTASAFSRKPLCGVFRHVLELGLRTARPIENHCAYSSHRKPLFPQESTVLRSKHHHNSENELYSMVARNYLSVGNTRRLLREERPR